MPMKEYTHLYDSNPRQYLDLKPLTLVQIGGPWASLQSKYITQSDDLEQLENNSADLQLLQSTWGGSYGPGRTKMIKKLEFESPIPLEYEADFHLQNWCVQNIQNNRFYIEQ